MTYAVELYLDAAGDRAVRQLWAACDAVGLPSLATEPARTYRPHISLYVADHLDLAALPVAALDACLGLPLTLGDILIAPRRPPIAFLAVAGGPALADAQARVARAFEPHATVPWPAYLPDGYVPKCSLTLQARDLDRVAAVAASREPTPRCRVASVSVVDISDGTSGIVREDAARLTAPKPEATMNHDKDN
jgi:hypothetical protein